MSRSRTGKRPVVAEPTSAAAAPKYRFRWSRRSERDLDEIEAYIAADDPVAAARWVDRLMERAQKAAWVPFSGRVVPELGRENIREVLLRTYRIVYRIEGSEVQVLTVFEGHRLFPEDVNTEGDSD